MHHLKVILILLLKNIIIHADVVVSAMNDEVSAISSQIVEQIEVILEIVLSEVSKLIDSVMSMRKGRPKKPQVSWEKRIP